MVYVRLDREWIDKAGAGHAAGDMIDVDAGTLAELESTGIVAGPPESTAGTKYLEERPAYGGFGQG